MHNFGAEDHIVPCFFRVTTRAVPSTSNVVRSVPRIRTEIVVAFRFASAPFTRRSPSGWIAHFQLDVGLVSEAHLRRHELTDEPPGAPHLIDCRIAKIERSVHTHPARSTCLIEDDRRRDTFDRETMACQSGAEARRSLGQAVADGIRREADRSNSGTSLAAGKGSRARSCCAAWLSAPCSRLSASVFSSRSSLVLKEPELVFQAPRCASAVVFSEYP